MDDTLSTVRVRGGLVLALLLAGCSSFQGTTATSFMMKIRNSPDPNVRFLAYQNLASPRCYDTEAQKAEAVRVLIEKLEAEKEPVACRAAICRTLGELRNPAAREVLIRAVNDPDSSLGVVRVQACRALGKVGKTEDATILARIMNLDNLEDCRIAAIEGLGELKALDPRIMEVLVNGMDHDDPAIRLASLEALRKITGIDLGVKPGPWRDLLKPKAPTAPASAAPAAAPESGVAAQPQPPRATVR
jgi:HEAT repeat protein